MNCLLCSYGTSRAPFSPRIPANRSLPSSHCGGRFSTTWRFDRCDGNRSTVCLAGQGSESFFYRPRRESGYEEPITEENSELVRIISELEVSEMEHVKEHVSKEAVDAMHRTVSGMLGLLPPHQFQVKISAHRDPLSNILLSSLCTGYALKNAEFRMQLSQSMQASQPKLRPDQDSLDEGVAELSKSERKNLSPETLAYIETLEARLQAVESSTSDPSPSQAGSANSLLSYVREMTPEAINKLSQDASREVIQAFNIIIRKTLEDIKPATKPSRRMLGRSRFILPEVKFEQQQQQPHQQRSFGTTFSLSRECLTDALFWCMLVGYYTKGAEYRLTLEQCMLGGEEGGEHGDEEDGKQKGWLERLGSLFDSQS